MTKSAWKSRAISALKAQATTKDPSAGACRWCDPQARRPSQAAIGKGLSKSMCRPHADHLHRHGHPLKPSYKATDLRPLENLSKRWLRASLAEEAAAPTIRQAVLRVRSLILRGRDTGLTFPTQTKPKAAAIIGRLHAKYCGERQPNVRTRWPKQRAVDVLALELAAIALSVELAEVLDPAPASNPRFAETQIGKVVFRRAGGWHRHSEREDPSKLEYKADAQGHLQRGPALYRVELNRFAISRGPALTMIGKQLREAIESVWQKHGAELEALARAKQLPPIESWTMARLKPVANMRGGKRARRPEHSRLGGGPHDRTRKLTRNL